MPVSYRGRGRGSSERTYQTLMDWTRRIMQLAVVATVLLYAYLMYGLFAGDVGNWAHLAAAEKTRIATNIEGAVFYLNIALGVLLFTVCILYYDEEALGYVLIAASVVLYFGLPFLLNEGLGNQLTEWQRTQNRAALAILNQLKIAAIMMAVPGSLLAIRDLIMRVVYGSARHKEEFSAMQYGGNVHEEAPPNKPLVGVMAKCWQLAFCRDAIRKGCPIYHARTRCWKERVGCMCEENVIRHAMDALIGKELITMEEPKETEEEFITTGVGATVAKSDVADEKTVEVARRPPPPPPNPRNVKIPHNPNLPHSVKVERCKNCVIYNEHQRLKYQFLAPLLVMSVPALAFFQMENMMNLLGRVLSTADSLMSRLSLASGAPGTNLRGSIGGEGMVTYMILGCLVIIGTTMVLRFLEYCVFKLKI